MKTPLFIYALLLMTTVIDAPAQRDSDRHTDQEVTFKLVINAANPTTSMKSKDVSRIFLKKLVRWEMWQDGDEKMKIIPVGREKDAEVRKSFSSHVHGKSATAIEFYWQRQIFSGNDVNPERLPSDEEVLKFVRAHPGAIGYVSSGAELGKGVKELKISE